MTRVTCDACGTDLVDREEANTVTIRLCPNGHIAAGFTVWDEPEAEDEDDEA